MADVVLTVKGFYLDMTHPQKAARQSICNTGPGTTINPPTLEEPDTRAGRIRALLLTDEAVVDGCSK